MRFIIAAIICLGINHLHAQSVFKIEQELLSQFKKIRPAETTGQEDSLQKANEIFLTSLLKYTSTVHATITFDFNELVKEGLVVKTSDDGLFRIYSWDTYTGGSAHIFNGIYQYKADGNLFSKSYRTSDNDFGCFFSHIYSTKTEDKIFYLGIYHVIESSSLSYQGIKAFCIENNHLNDTVHIIKTRTGIRNQLGFEYDFFSVKNHPERPVKLIYCDEDDQQLHLSVVLENGTVTKRFITYQFTGKYFERIN